MADQSQLETALRNADAAGDTQAAKILAGELQKSRTPAAPAEKSIREIWHDPSLGVIGEGAKQLAAGVGTGFASGVKALSHPIDTLESLAKTVPRMAAEAVREPIETAKKVGSYVENITPRQVGEIAGGAVVGGAAGRALGIAGDIAADYNVARGAGEAVGDVVKKGTVKEARTAGLAVPPSVAGAKVGTIAEGLTGRKALMNELSIKNQPKITQLAASDIGLPKNEPMTAEALEKAKAPHNAVYKEMAALPGDDASPEYLKAVGNVGRSPNARLGSQDVRVTKLQQEYNVPQFTSDEAVQRVRELREDAVANLKNGGAAEKQLGKAQKKIADALDAELARRARAVGNKDLARRFLEARKKLAQIHNVQEAFDDANGTVSARKLAQQRAAGAPLSGNLRTIARAYRVMPDAMRDTPVKGGAPFSTVDYLIGAGAAAHNPALLGAVVARPAIRAGLSSGAYQATLGQAAGTAGGSVLPAAGATLGGLATQENQ